MVETGEVAHEIPHVDLNTPPDKGEMAKPEGVNEKPSTPPDLPLSREVAKPEWVSKNYPGGADPYREPIN